MNSIKRTVIMIAAFMLLLISIVFCTPAGYCVEGAPQATSLAIECGTLVPEFEPDIYEYTVYVDKNAENRSCVAIVEFDGDDVGVNVEGPTEFDDKDITKTVTLSDSDGDQTEYKINVHIATGDEMVVNGMLYKIATDIDSEDIPSGFTMEAGKFNGQDVNLAVDENSDMRMIPFADANDASVITWYTVDDNGKLGKPVEIKEMSGNGYMMIEPSDSDSVIMVKSGGIFGSIIGGGIGKYAVPGVMALIIIILLIYIISLKKGDTKNKKGDGRYFRTHLTLEDENHKDNN